MFGTWVIRSGPPAIWLRVRSSCVNALIAIGTSWMSSSRFWAVTISASTSAPPPATLSGWGSDEPPWTMAKVSPVRVKLSPVPWSSWASATSGSAGAAKPRVTLASIRSIGAMTA